MVRILHGRKSEISLVSASVIIAEDLSPSETLQLDKSLIRAFVIRRGSANSHTAILARTLCIPSLIQADIPLDPSINGRPIAVDAHEGKIYLEPDARALGLLEARQSKDREAEARLEKFKGLPSVTKEGTKVKLYANIGGGEDLDAVLANDAEGIGLFRSEFLYLSRDSFPCEDEQFEVYRRVAEGMRDKPVIIRTMDIGADKNIPYFDLAPEENPALGFRAIRICFDRPDIFKTQLRAIYRTGVYGTVSIMFPMIASLWELRRCKEAAAEAREELKAEGTPFAELPLGVMIETPAAALIADELAREADFFSVGTNDLTQYTLAADRQNEKLIAHADPHHPAVLRLLKMTAESARQAGIWAGICGEFAADLSMTETFLEMGYTELSVAAGFVLPVRERIRSISLGGKK
jgi:phosphotransferase system enzyme I (PtsI)